MLHYVFQHTIANCKPTKSINNWAATAAAGDFCGLPLYARATILTWQLTLCQSGCAERCIRSDNEEHISSWEWGN